MDPATSLWIVAPAAGAAIGWATNALAVRMLDAFAKQDEALVSECSRSNDLVSLDNQLALLARSLSLKSVSVPVSMLIVSKSGGSKAGGPSAPEVVPEAQEEGTGDFGELAPEDVPEEDDLC